MNDKALKNPEMLPCEVCLSEIPDSVNMSAEADEYVSSYCGLECYQQWLEQAANKEKES